MYKATIRASMRYAVRKLNEGDTTLFLKLAHPDFFIAFPGDNSWSTMHRPVETSRKQFPTHRGIEECQAFGDRFTEEGIQFSIEDILINGTPRHTRVALRVQSYLPGPDGEDEYNNRAIALLEMKWGRLVAWEDYEDTERVAAWDRRRAAS